MCLSDTGHLLLKMLNAYYLLVDYEEVSRYVTIVAVNTGGQDGLEN